MHHIVVQNAGKAVVAVGIAAITYLADKMIDKYDDISITVNSSYGFSFTFEGHNDSK